MGALIETPNSLIYRIEDVEVDVTRACLTRAGAEVRVQPKAFRLLLHLLKERDRLVTKEELMELFWKDTAVTDDALTQCVAELRRALGKPGYLKTVPRMGYRFVGPVEEVRPEPARPAEARREPTPLGTSGLRVGRLAMAALALVSLAGGAFWTGVVRRDPLPQANAKRRVAVIRFENRSGQADLDWLRDGLPDMLGTTLSKSRSLEVLGRSESAPAAAQLTVSGSYSQLGGSMRVDAQVHDAQTGQLLGAEDITVDRQEQLLAQVDYLAARLAARIAPPSLDPDRRVLASLMTDNLEAYRLYSLGLEKAEALQTPEAIGLFEKALALDPGFAMAAARIGYAYAVTDSQLGKGRPYLEKAFRMSAKLTDKDRRHIVAWYAIANRDYASAIRLYDELIAEYPNEAEAYFRLAMLLRGESRHEEAIDLLHRASALDPADPKIYNGLAAVFSEMGRHDEALAMVSRYVALAPQDPNAYDSLALCYQFAGQADRALEAYQKALDLKPEFVIASLHRALYRGHLGQVRESLRESLEHAERGRTDVEQRRGWEQAAWVEWREGALEAAKGYALRALQIPLEGVHYMNPAFLLAKPGAPKAVEPGLPAGRGSQYGSRSVSFFLAEEARSQGRTEDWLRNLRQVLRFRPFWGESDVYEDALGDAYLQLGRWDDAIAEYERALRLFPGMALARFHLGQAYEHAGRASAASVQFRQFLELWKHADAELPELAEARRLSHE